MFTKRDAWWWTEKADMIKSISPPTVIRKSSKRNYYQFKEDDLKVNIKS